MIDLTHFDFQTLAAMQQIITEQSRMQVWQKLAQIIQSQSTKLPASERSVQCHSLSDCLTGRQNMATGKKQIADVRINMQRCN